jgi:hypothetical protein
MQKIKVEVIYDFYLNEKDYETIKDTIQRKTRKEDGRLFKEDTFECDKELAEYFLGKNKLKKAFIRVIEVIPEKIENQKEKEQTLKKTIAKK